MRASLRETALVLVAVSLFFLGTHLSALPPRVLAPTDLLTRFAPYGELAPPEASGPKNVLLLDAVLQFIPWHEHSRRALAAGRLPTWNPAPGLGTIHLANDQAAVFSPFSWIVFLFGPYGLLLAGWAKSLVLALGVFVFLRQQGISPRAAALGGLALSASAPVVAWQLHPHTCTFAWVGWLLLTAERSARERQLGVGTIGLALVTAATLVAGHLQTALHLSLLIALWVVVVAHGVRRERGNLAGALALLRPLAGALLGLGLAAPHLLPFLAALRDSAELVERASGATAVSPLERLPLLLFPDLLGSPREGIGGGAVGHLELAPAYAGAAIAALAGVGHLQRSPHRPTVSAVFAVALLGTLGVVFGVLDQALAVVPPFDVTRNHRLVFVAALAVAVLGAVGFDAAVRRRETDPSSIRTATMWVATGVFLATVLTLGLGDFLRDAPTPSAAGRPGRTLTAAIAVPLGAVVLCLAVLRSGRPRRWVELALVAIVTLELLVFSADVAPGNPRDSLAPTLPALEPLRGERVLCLGNVLPPNLALDHGLKPTRSYDALGNARTRRRLERLAPFRGPLMGSFRFDDREADALGIRYVLTDDPLLVKNLERGIGGWLPYQPLARGELLRIGKQTYRHDFTLINPVSVLALPEVQAAAPTELRLRLRDRTGKLLREARQRVERGTHEVLFQFGRLGRLDAGLRLVLELDGDVRVAHRGGNLTFLLADRVSVPYARVETPWKGCWVLDNVDARSRAQPIGPGTARIVGDGPDWVEVEVLGVERLRLADAWAKGWVATCDGAPVEVEEVDGLREVSVTSGTQRVRFDYHAPGLRLGLILCLACALGMAVVFGLSVREEERPESS